MRKILVFVILAEINFNFKFIIIMTYYQTAIEAWKQGDHKKAIQYFNYASQYGAEYEIKNAKMYLSEYEKLGDSITKKQDRFIKRKITQY